MSGTGQRTRSEAVNGPLKSGMRGRVCSTKYKEPVLAKFLLKRMVFIGVLLAAAACGEPSKGDILEKAKGITAKTELAKALGKPDDINKLGPIETWTYKASNGEVVFLITGETVALQAAGSSQ